MLRNYLKTAVRSLLQHAGYSLINVVGLAIGMAGAVLVGLFVVHELSYDRYHTKADRIYRLVSQDKARMPIPLASLLEQRLPEVQAVRIHGGWGPAMSYGDKRFYRRVRFADGDIFELFDFTFHRGDPATALDRPYTIVLHPEIARMFFGDDDPIGKVLTWDDTYDYEVTAVVEVPDHTHFDFGLLASYSTVEARGPQFGNQEDLEYWGYHSVRSKYTYLLLPDGFDTVGFGQRVLDLIETHAGAEASRRFRDEIGVPRLQALTDIHLRSHLSDELERNGDTAQVGLVAAIGFFLLLIACINFINLSTARSVRRTREVGVRKVLGAYRGQLVRQFLGETLLLALVGMILAVGLAEMATPLFQGFVGRDIGLRLSDHPLLPLGLLAIVLLTGAFAGTYPALYLSGVQPAHTLKTRGARGGRGSVLRRCLVVFQFVISIALTVAAAVVHEQLGFLQHRDLGYDRDQVLMLEIDYPGAVDKVPEMSAALRQHPGVIAVAALRHPPGRRLLEIGNLQAAGSDREPVDMPALNVEPGFLEMMEMQLAAGRTFQRQAGDDRRALIVNRAALPGLGFATPEAALGETFEYRFDRFGGQATIVGVMENVHFEPLHRPIGPLFVACHDEPWAFHRLAVKVRAGDLSATIADVRAVWERLVPHLPFGYWFLDEGFAYLYLEEERLADMLGIFTLLAIFVAVLGILGLAAFSAEQRTSEIGVRKVLGATVSSLILLLSREYALLVLLATVLAAPVAYLALEGWLQTFPYHTPIGLRWFVAGSSLTLIIAWLTVSWQGLRAALSDPVQTLRCE